MQASLQSPPSAVAAEVANRDVLTCPQLARRGPSTRQGKPLHPSTVLRWILDGVKTADGRRVKLEACRCGGRWVSSAAAFERFLQIQTPILSDIPVPQTPTQRVRNAERAGKELEKLGING